MRLHAPIAALLLALLAGACWYAAEGGTNAAHGDDNEAGLAARAPATSESPQARAIRAGLVIDARERAEPVVNLSGDGLNVQQALLAAMAEREMPDLVLAGAVQDAMEVCYHGVPAEGTAAWRDRDRRWAAAYLRMACEGFDHRAFSAAWDQDEEEGVEITDANVHIADSEAREILSTTDSQRDLFMAAYHLTQRGLLPGEAQFGLDGNGMMYATNTAIALRTCAATGACGSGSFATAALCVEFGCAYGTTYREALRLKVTPAEFEAALELERLFAKRR